MIKLELYSRSLRKLLDEEIDLFVFPLVSSAPNPIFWSSWIFRESARRTFLVCSLLLGLYQTLKGGTVCTKAAARSQIWTLSAHLWNAPSAFDFGIAWQKRKHFEITNMNFAEVIQEAKPDDMDSLGKIFLVAYLGLDDAKWWFYERGDTLLVNG
jgi:hypothetical protein